MAKPLGGRPAAKRAKALEQHHIALRLQHWQRRGSSAGERAQPGLLCYRVCGQQLQAARCKHDCGHVLGGPGRQRCSQPHPTAAAVRLTPPLRRLQLLPLLLLLLLLGQLHLPLQAQPQRPAQLTSHWCHCRCSHRRRCANAQRQPRAARHSARRGKQRGCGLFEASLLCYRQERGGEGAPPLVTRTRAQRRQADQAAAQLLGPHGQRLQVPPGCL
jgi:hypothetical protein